MSDKPIRRRILYTLDIANIEYVEKKGELFKRGRRGGNSEALNRIIKFARDYEESMDG